MKRSLCICVVSGVLFCGSLVRLAEARPPECGNSELLSCLGWTEAQRQADPEGFFDAAVERLKREAAECQEARTSLTKDIDRQTQAIDAKVELWRKAADVADQFRDAYQRAKRANCWPVKVCDAEYSEERLAAQVSLLMKEAEALADCVAKMKQTREQAEARLEDLTAQAQVVDSQISMVTTKFELWKASRLESRGNELLALLDQLIIKHRPVTFRPQRTEDGFAFIPAGSVESHPHAEILVGYLSHRPTSGKVQIQTQNSVGKAGPKKAIFQQN